ncbi:hypothetical protein POM88_005971 [Heracleum sosnowskyi]|uniref:ATP-dependent DNA helicase n=1 Tax=Heracleum sosnowskyi TaxID=360622 RepID=A0AAD8N624_9APIA|nr:hypothetical protein POM88_005971 [Heracleum sosnowskyi]
MNNGRGPYVFRVNGHTYHSLGSLVPPDGLTPKFAQLYMYDGQDAVAHRLNFSGKTGDVDPAIVSVLQEMLDRDNVLVGMFKQMRDRFTNVKPEPVCLRLLERRTTDGRIENLPTVNDYEFAALVVDNNFVNCRDVVAEHKQRGLQHISDFVRRGDVEATDVVRPDLVARVFKMKLDSMVNDLTKKNVLGRVLAVVYTVEFQKCGLPHAHIVLWLAAADKLLTTEDIDNVISAEIPDKETNPVGYKAVSQFMMHGPCGAANPKCPCMSNGQCTKHFPKHFSDATVVDEDGYALYRRRNTKTTVECNGIHLDNRHVVPYHRGLLGREEVVAASINKSRLWECCKVFNLRENMRIESNVPPITIHGQKIPFRDWVLALGDGLQPAIAIGDDTEPSWIALPDEVQVQYSGDPIEAIVHEIYDDLHHKHGDVEYLLNRAILTPLNEHVDSVNVTVLYRLPGEFKIYKSCDSICKGSSNSEADEILYPPEYLNSIKSSGMPNHEIRVKVGAPIMLLRNLNAKRAVSRVTSPNGLKIVTGGEDVRTNGYTRNIVYREVFQNIL